MSMSRRTHLREHRASSRPVLSSLPRRQEPRVGHRTPGPAMLVRWIPSACGSRTTSTPWPGCSARPISCGGSRVGARSIGSSGITRGRTATSTSASGATSYQRVAAELAAHLELQITHDGKLIPLTGRADPADDSIHGLWAREVGGGPWRLQINLEPCAGDEWTYRRDPRVHRPLDAVIRHRAGVPCVNPAVQLLWKARDHTPKDETDLANVLPLLAIDERAWLAHAIATAHPESPWRERVEHATPEVSYLQMLWSGSSAGVGSGRSLASVARRTSALLEQQRELVGFRRAGATGSRGGRDRSTYSATAKPMTQRSWNRDRTSTGVPTAIGESGRSMSTRSSGWVPSAPGSIDPPRAPAAWQRSVARTRAPSRGAGTRPRRAAGAGRAGRSRGCSAMLSNASATRCSASTNSVWRSSVRASMHRRSRPRCRGAARRGSSRTRSRARRADRRARRAATLSTTRDAGSPTRRIIDGHPRGAPRAPACAGTHVHCRERTATAEIDLGCRARPVRPTSPLARRSPTARRSAAVRYRVVGSVPSAGQHASP